jgi:hypothetical protein
MASVEVGNQAERRAPGGADGDDRGGERQMGLAAGSAALGAAAQPAEVGEAERCSHMAWSVR